jgi:HEAT repeat protein
LAAVLLLLAAGAPASPFLEEMAARQRPERHAALISHGVNTTPGALLHFVQNGFSDAALARGLPREPRVKTEVMNYAIQELGYQQVIAAVPLLTSLLDGDGTPGMQRVLQFDAEPLPIAGVMEYRAELFTFLRFNAMVALGLIGEPEGIPAVRALIERENRAGFLAEGAIALALMGDAGTLDRLARRAAETTGEEQEVCFGAIFLLTGRNYGVTEETSVARRKQHVADLRAWMQTPEARAEIARRDVLRRRATGAQIPEVPVNTLRGALRATRQFDDYERRYAARQRLRTIAPASTDELRALCLDPLEDNDIRVAAMDWYAASSPEEARRTIRRLRDDENPPVRQRAHLLLEEINRALALRK